MEFICYFTFPGRYSAFVDFKYCDPWNLSVFVHIAHFKFRFFKYLISLSLLTLLLWVWRLLKTI